MKANNKKPSRAEHFYTTKIPNMKAILIETGLVVGATIFWAVALPVTMIFFAFASLWQSVRRKSRAARRGIVIVHRSVAARA